MTASKKINTSAKAKKIQETKALNRALKKLAENNGNVKKLTDAEAAAYDRNIEWKNSEQGKTAIAHAKDIEQTLIGKQVIMQVQVPKTPSSIASERQVGGSHYKTMGVQTWDVVDTWPLDQRIGYYRGNALKYLMRMGSKDQNAVEIAKGEHYVEKLLEVLKEQNGTN